MRVLLVVLAGAALTVLARLFQLQVVEGDTYRSLAQDLPRRTREVLPFVRGSIVDRLGEPLVTDEPAWEICVDYRVLAFDADRMREYSSAYGLKRRYAALGPLPDLASAFGAELDGMWRELARFEGVPLEDIRQRRDQIVARIRRIRERKAQAAGFDEEILEERCAHAVVADLTPQQCVEAREQFQRYPWVHVKPAKQRSYHDAQPFAHLLGRLGSVDQADLENDPNAGDALASYLADERIGKSGVEKLADARLRGRRGERWLDRWGRMIEGSMVEAENGRDVRLTVRGDLQRRLYDLLDEVVAGHADVSGGCMVVVDVGTRDLLACISYPAYDPATCSQDYVRLRDQTDRLPLVFRAAATQYAPGSIVKPLTCIAGLADDSLETGSVEHCAGYLFPEHPEAGASKCWEIEGTGQRMRHGDVDVVAALRGSCNIFMYRLGERMGAQALCHWFDLVGLGRETGIGLAEEIRGINPTGSYLAARGLPVIPAHPRLFAIGQGELAVTPLQAANLIACYASGQYRPLRLLADEPAGPATRLPGEPAEWRAIRQGMYEVVNHVSGTAHKYISFADDGYVLCGKTGSATAPPRPTLYAVPAATTDGREDVFYIPAGSAADALDRFGRAHPEWTPRRGELRVARTWPADTLNAKGLAHAWFGGFLQPRGPDGGPDWNADAAVAFAVLLEFGGSGGRVSGPVAGEAARILLDVLGPELNAESAGVDGA